jgi:hypothetical protein
MAAVLACGEEALLSHRSNAGLRSLLPDGRAVIDVTVPGRASRRNGNIVIHGARSLHPDDIDVYDGIPCTSVARMLLEVAETSPARQLARTFEAAERERVLDMRKVEETLARSHGHRGAKSLVSLMEQLTDPPPNVRSELERRVLEGCDAAGMPRPQLNVSVGGREIDMVWGKVLVELDSWKHHGTRAAFERDRERRRDPAAQGLHPASLYMAAGRRKPGCPHCCRSRGDAASFRGVSDWKVKVRVGPRVEKSGHERLREAMREIERRGHELEASADAKPRSPLGRTFEPVQQVVARIEIAGPNRRRGGIDIRGDGSAEAFTGRLRREVIEQRGNESPYDALKRALK